MKKLLLFALGALLATSVSAGNGRREQKEVFRFRNGDKVVLIKEAPKGPQKAFRAKGRQADFRFEQFNKGFRKGQFRKKDFRRFPKQACRKCHKPHRRYIIL